MSDDMDDMQKQLVELMSMVNNALTNIETLEKEPTNDNVRAYWLVTGGVIPGEKEEQYTKTFVYTSADYAHDMSHSLQSTLMEGHPTNFEIQMKHAHDYAQEISNPSMLNWVNVQFMWL